MLLYNHHPDDHDGQGAGEEVQEAGAQYHGAGGYKKQVGHRLCQKWHCCHYCVIVAFIIVVSMDAKIRSRWVVINVITTWMAQYPKFSWRHSPSPSPIISLSSSSSTSKTIGKVTIHSLGSLDLPMPLGFQGCCQQSEEWERVKFDTKFHKKNTIRGGCRTQNKIWIGLIF